MNATSSNYETGATENYSTMETGLVNINPMKIGWWNVLTRDLTWNYTGIFNNPDGSPNWWSMLRIPFIALTVVLVFAVGFAIMSAIIALFG
jgi:hypothetical protein